MKILTYLILILLLFPICLANNMTSNQSLKITENNIPNDVDNYLSYWANKLIPSNEQLGKIIILIIFIGLIFFKDLNNLISKVRFKEW